MLNLERLSGQVHRVSEPNEQWSFRVDCPMADQIHLVAGLDDGSTVWTPMIREADGPWRARLNLRPGDYRFRYFITRGNTMLSGGDSGLCADRFLGDRPEVEPAALSVA